MKAAVASRSKPERYPLRTVKGGFKPADAMAAARMRDLGIRTGDLVFVEFKKPRSPKFHRFAHALATLFVENIEAFEGMAPHACLKRVQLEAGIECDEVDVLMCYLWPRVVAWVRECLGDPFAAVLQGALEAIGGKASTIRVRIPRSLSFERMDETAFSELVRGICRHVAKTYWPSMTPEAIEEMALSMAGVA